MRVAVVIPARRASSRLAGKMLLARTGKPLIVHTWENAARATCAERVLVATDDAEIASAVRAHGGDAVMTAADHPNGTARVAEAARDLNVDVVVNVQGDEPELDPAAIDRVVEALERSGAFAATLAAPFPDGRATGPGSPEDPASVKAVLGAAREGWRPAHWFTRAPAPAAPDGAPAPERFLHLGVYAMSPAALARYVSWPEGPLERAERLEQLRILENGARIAAAVIDRAHKGVDTEADYAAFVARMKEGAG